ncbi:hypothetical protein H7J86_24340 [Mycobacterium hackensackense]|uniref:hypothetical protein n=1 Tax=Mycobacterium hackensackense TaxID=228909 RepID=UPI002265CF70|nr:hypothetical protein [Mycobacterium hackensackense]MCV7255297.1 hypothetical protein [Mycobacterium hackensackense]
MRDPYDPYADERVSAQQAAEAAGPKPTSGRPPHLDPDAIAACNRCGPDGYAGTQVCLHQDPSQFARAAREGKARALAELEEAKRAKENRQ